MQNLEWKEVKEWDAKTIDAKVGEIRKQLFEMRMQKVAAGYDKPHHFKVGKKNIARLLTAKGQNAKGDK
ncbi:MAG: 50S ribosomal protein L29 [Bacteriovoracaceae bacterium]|nr:50S ribosomal protein L29 [Bacteriovoracaceae bacterium]